MCIYKNIKLYTLNIHNFFMSKLSQVVQKTHIPVYNTGTVKQQDAGIIDAVLGINTLYH